MYNPEELGKSLNTSLILKDKFVYLKIDVDFFRFPRFKLSNTMLFFIYCALGWGVPLCFLALTITAQYLDGPYMKPGFGDRSCWFNGKYWIIKLFWKLLQLHLCLNRILRDTVVFLCPNTGSTSVELCLPSINQLEALAQIRNIRLQPCSST